MTRTCLVCFEEDKTFPETKTFKCFCKTDVCVDCTKKINKCTICQNSNYTVLIETPVTPVISNVQRNNNQNIPFNECLEFLGTCCLLIGMIIGITLFSAFASLSLENDPENIQEPNPFHEKNVISHQFWINEFESGTTEWSIVEESVFDNVYYSLKYFWIYF